MLLAGADPLKAVSYQLVVMYMMVTVALLSAVFSVKFSYQVIIGAALKEQI
jgi:putative ABC transport system permease protein